MSDQKHSPLKAYATLRKHLARAAEMTDAAEWEEALVSVDEARFAIQYLEHFQRINAKKKAA